MIPQVDMPDELDLSSLRAQGVQEGELLMPEDEAPKEEIYENAEVVAQLMEMGFSKEGCRRAVHQTKNAGIDAAMAWVMEHMGDPDFNTPLQAASSGTNLMGVIL